MNGSERAREYATLALTITLASYAIFYCLVLVHEVGHGCTALALGGYFPFVQVGGGGGKAVYLFPTDSPKWKDVLVLLSGPLVNFLIAAVMLGLNASGIRRREVRLLTLLTGLLSAVGFITSAGLLSLLQPGKGDAGRALGLMGLPRASHYLVAAIWLLLGLGLAASLFRLFFKELADLFPVETYGARFILIAAAVAVPALLIVGAQSLGPADSDGTAGGLAGVRQLSFVIFLLLLNFSLPFAVKYGGADRDKQRLGISRRQFALLLLAAAAVATVQPAVFGSDGANPKGLFLSPKPPEVTVSACNVILTLDEEYRARVRVLMRPFVDEHKFLWQRIKDGEPEDWSAYEAFVRQNIPLMLGTEDCRIIRHYSDREAEFFNGAWDRGARVVEAEVNLSRLPYLKGNQNVRVLRVEDFWRSRGAGYIDLTEVRLEGGLQFGGLKSQPDGAARPVVHSPSRLRWENTSLERSFAVSYMAIN